MRSHGSCNTCTGSLCSAEPSFNTIRGNSFSIPEAQAYVNTRYGTGFSSGSWKSKEVIASCLLYTHPEGSALTVTPQFPGLSMAFAKGMSVT